MDDGRGAVRPEIANRIELLHVANGRIGALTAQPYVSSWLR